MISVVLLRTLEVSLREHQASPQRETFTNTTGLCSSKMSRSASQSKSEESARLKSRYWTCCSEMARACKDSSQATDGVRKCSVNRCSSPIRDGLLKFRSEESILLLVTLNSLGENNDVCVHRYMCVYMCVYVCVHIHTEREKGTRTHLNGQEC